MLHIKSQNPDLSYVLKKNPANVFSRKIRKGVAVGFYNDEQAMDFTLLFESEGGYTSFRTDETESLMDISDTCSPMLINQLINNCLRDALNGAAPWDETRYECVLEIPFLRTYRKRMLESITKTFNDASNSVVASVTKHGGELDTADLYSVTFKSHCVMNVLKAASLSMLMLAGKHEANMGKINDEFLMKYSNMLQYLSVGYYMRYNFARQFLIGNDTFKKYVHWLDTNTIQLEFGNTQDQRYAFIKSQFTAGLPIVDFGCGEGFNTMRLAELSPYQVIAHDISDEEVTATHRKARARGLDVFATADVNEVYERCNQVVIPHNLILAEVLEHMPKNTAHELLLNILDNINVEKAIISLPNKSFNQHFMIPDDETRHDDHDWEPTYQEALEFLHQVVGTYNEQVKPECRYELSYGRYGDRVGNEQVTHYFTIERVTKSKIAIITVGPSACGKSSFAKKLCGLTKDSAKPFYEVNRDDYRFPTGKRDWNEWVATAANEKKITDKAHKRIDGNIKAGNNVIISDTNLNVKRRFDLIERFVDAGYEVYVKHFDIELDQLLKQSEMQEGAVPHEVVIGHWLKHQREIQNITPYEAPKSRDQGYIIDVDGTLFDVDWRDPFDYDKIPEDPAFVNVLAMMGALHGAGENIVIMSGRTEDQQSATMKRFDQVCSENNIHMTSKDVVWYFRQNGDSRKDYIVKREMWEHLQSMAWARNSCWTVLDDRPQTVEQCWSLLGVPVWDVNPKGKKRF